MSLEVNKTDPGTNGAVYQGSRTKDQSAPAGNRTSSYSPITAPQNSSALFIDSSKNSTDPVDAYISFAFEKTGYSSDPIAPANDPDFARKVMNCVKNNLNSSKLLENNAPGIEEYFALKTFVVMLESLGYAINYDDTPQLLTSLKWAFSAYNNSPRQVVDAYVRKMDDNLQELKDIKTERTVFVSLGGNVNGTDVPLGVACLNVKDADINYVHCQNGGKYVLRLATGEDPLYGALGQLAEQCKKPLKGGQQIGTKEMNDMFIEYGENFIDQSNDQLKDIINAQKECLNKFNSSLSQGDIKDILQNEKDVEDDIGPATMAEPGGAPKTWRMNSFW